MISVALGTENFQFTRPLEWIDRAIDEGVIPKDEDVIVQAGKTLYDERNKNIQIYAFAAYEDLMAEIKECRIGIIHAGMGNILDYVDIDKIPIVIPRDHKLNEHLDDHQFQFCEVAKKHLEIPFVYTYEEFIEAIKNYNPKVKFKSKNKELVDFLVSTVEGI